MRMLSDAVLSEASFMGGPGVDELRWLAPVRVGDRVALAATVIETRPSASRPGLGFVKLRLEMTNGEGKPVLSMVVSPMFGRRPAAPLPAPERAAPEPP
jgi:acyl dehydratase